MNQASRLVVIAALAAAATIAAEPSAPPTVSRVFNQQLSSIEREIVSLAEAMPAEKFDFAPTQGEFNGVRTFRQQMTHVATVIYMVSASVLAEANPSETGSNENGPVSIKTKEQAVKYLKDAFGYGHKAMESLTDANLMAMVKSAFGDNKVPRASMASAAVWHSFDHYGQAVVYARMNGIVPPASR